MGTPDFSVSVLESLIKNTNVSLVVTQPDKLVGRKQILSSSPIKKIADKYNIDVFQPENIKEDYKRILTTPADIIITCAYGQIIPKAILDYPPLGCINVHASLLPKYRGGAPIHRCLINGEEKSGITIMYMAEGMDNGDIIEQEEYKILPSDNVLTLHDKLSLIGANLLIKTLPSIINHTNKRIKQDESLVTYAKNIKREEEQLNFSENAQDIVNKIRGLNPWPLAYFTLDNSEIKVISASFILKDVDSIKTVVEVSKEKLGISCKDGIIYLERVKPAGKKEMDIKDYLNGINKDNIIGKKVE